MNKKNWVYYTSCFLNGLVFSGFLFSALLAMAGEAPNRLAYILCCITGALQAVQLAIRDYEDSK